MAVAGDLRWQLGLFRVADIQLSAGNWYYHHRSSCFLLFRLLALVGEKGIHLEALFRETTKIVGNAGTGLLGRMELLLAMLAFRLL